MPLDAHCWRTHRLSTPQLNRLATEMLKLPDVTLSVELAETAFRQISELQVRRLTNEAMQCHLIPTETPQFCRGPKGGVSIEAYELACQAVGCAGLAIVTQGIIPWEDTRLLMTPWRAVMESQSMLAAVST
jgi:hypothetical protein